MPARCLFRPPAIRTDPVSQADGHVDRYDRQMGIACQQVGKARKERQSQAGRILQIAQHGNPAGFAPVNACDPGACAVRHGLWFQRHGGT